MTGRRISKLDAAMAAVKDAAVLSEAISQLMVQSGRKKPRYRLAGGGEWKMVCPFHNDHDPSLDVNDSKGVWLCRSAQCQSEDRDGKMRQRGGNIIGFARELNGWSFREALERVAAMLSVDLSPFMAEPTPEEIQAEKARQEFERLYAEATPLEEWPGKPINKWTLKEFGVRSCPGHLVTTSGETLRWDTKDCPDDMIIMPLHDDEGVVCGWTTRSMGNSHISRNNPNSWPGARDDVIFGFYQARGHLRQMGSSLILVEGQTDAMAMHSAKIRNVGALRGVNLTDPQWRTINRWSLRQVIACLDGDKGGRAGTRRLAENFWNQPGAVLSIAQLESGDPAELIATGELMQLQLALTRPTNGAERRGLLDSAEYLLEQLCEGFDTDSISGRSAMIEHALRGLKMGQADGYQRKLIVAWISKRFGLPTLEVHDIFVEDSLPVSTTSEERAVLARAMRDPSWVADVATRITEDDFSLLRHQLIWRLILHAQEKGVDTEDVEMLRQFAVRHGYAPEIMAPELVADIVTRYTENDYPLETLTDASYRRQLQSGAALLQRRLVNANDDAHNAAAEYTAQVVDLSFWRQGSHRVMTREQQVDHTMEIIIGRRDNPNEIIGHDMGPCFPKLNLAFSGIQKRKLHVVAAPQSVGKTAFMNNLAGNICVHNSVPGLVVGLEMDYTEYHGRLLSQISGLPAREIESGRISPDMAPLLDQAAAKLRRAPLFFETPDVLTLEELKMMIRSYRMKHRIEVVFFDYFQLLTPGRGMNGMSRYQFFGEVAKSFKLEIARAMDVALVCAAQLNRGATQTKNYTSESIADSYQIVQTADTVLTLAESEGNATILDLRIDKNRQGVKDVTIPLRFDGATQTIYEAENGKNVPPYRVR